MRRLSNWLKKATQFFDNDVTIRNDLSVLNNVSVSYDLAVSGEITVDSTLNANEDVVIVGYLDCEDAAYFYSDIDVDGDITVAGSIDVETNIDVGGGLTVVGTLDVTDESTFTAKTVHNSGVELLSSLKVIALPTADPHVLNVVWNNSGVLTVSAG